MFKLASFKKMSFSMLLTFTLVLILAIPAHAASYAVQFLNSSGAPSTHSSKYIEGGVVDVTGTAGNYTVTFKMKNSDPSFPLIPISYNHLKVDLNGTPAGDGVYEVNSTKSVSGGFTYFTFSGVSNVTDNLPVLLHVNAGGFHSKEYALFVDWK
ncbi:hypothetical protein NQ117_14720 [Paenibacillus sp. SC116]|uniref:hypothetical protein n=1 Tax=Paenibacillus sp. SC116 TaxID=2968986 RepID=UPI00215A4676|nr:hypothetical protein [Paenibacillus sp. SC116]MCR8844933.1 hypothetical protein [Paenibacillus sp. SC116]